MAVSQRYQRRLAAAAVLVLASCALTAPSYADEPSEEIKIISLKYAQCEKTEKLVARLFDSDELRMAADRRTNSLILRGTAGVLNTVEALLHHLDREVSESATRDEKRAKLNSEDSAPDSNAASRNSGRADLQDSKPPGVRGPNRTLVRLEKKMREEGGKAEGAERPGVNASHEEDPIFSGPQVGEELAPFGAQRVFGDDAGEKVDVLADSSNAATLLVFVHQVTRPSIGLTRLLMGYAGSKKKAGLKASLVFLSNDPTETEAWMRRARRALPDEVTPLISPDGIEGPGAYGLNRKMTMTVLVGRKGKVTANFPLIQPSIQADGPKIGHAIAKALGEKEKPSLKDMGFKDRAMQSRMDGTYRRMMAPLIQKSATAEEVDKAAKAVEDLAAKNEAFKERVHNAANLIVNGGRLANYGTPKAQEYLKKWSKAMAPAKKREVNLDKEPDDESASAPDTGEAGNTESR